MNIDLGAAPVRTFLCRKQVSNGLRDIQDNRLQASGLVPGCYNKEKKAKKKKKKKKKKCWGYDYWPIRYT
jgi:hypothetical protein